MLTSHSLYLTSDMSISHSIKLPTCRLIILLNFRPVDNSLYWTPNLSTSHCIELPNYRLYTCILIDPSTSGSIKLRLIDQWLLICLSVKQSILLSYDKICRQDILSTHYLLTCHITWLSTCKQVNPMTHPSWISNSIVDQSSYMYLHY